MRDIVFCVGTAPADFSIISATFRQFDRPADLYFIPSVGEVFACLDQPGPLPSLIFMSLSPDRALVFELLQHLKAHPNYRWIPIILIGESHDQWSRDEVTSSGAAAMLTSPLEPAGLQRIFSPQGDLLIYPPGAPPVIAGPPRIGD
jgi:CheY-like chemotaxis protein